MNTLKKLVVASLLCVTGFTLRAQEIGGEVTSGMEAKIFPSNWHVPDDEINTNLQFSAVMSIQDHGTLPLWGPGLTASDAYLLSSFSEENLTGTNAVGMFVDLRGGTNHPISLDKITGEFTSDDPNHYLNQVIGFTNKTYSVGAALLQGNQWINSGPAFQSGSRIIVGFYSPHFGHNTLAQVREYGYNYPQWGITFTLKYDGVPVKSVTIKKAAPNPKVYLVNGDVIYGLSDVNNPAEYTVQKADVLGGEWVTLGKISRYGLVTNPPSAGPTGIVRLTYP